MLLCHRQFSIVDTPILETCILALIVNTMYDKMFLHFYLVNKIYAIVKVIEQLNIITLGSGWLNPAQFIVFKYCTKSKMIIDIL